MGGMATFDEVVRMERRHEDFGANPKSWCLAHAQRVIEMLWEWPREDGEALWVYALPDIRSACLSREFLAA